MIRIFTVMTRRMASLFVFPARFAVSWSGYLVLWRDRPAAEEDESGSGEWETDTDPSRSGDDASSSNEEE